MNDAEAHIEIRLTCYAPTDRASSEWAGGATGRVGNRLGFGGVWGVLRRYWAGGGSGAVVASNQRRFQR